MKQKRYTQEGSRQSHSTISSAKFKIVPTDVFIKEAHALAKKYSNIKEDFKNLRNTLQVDPTTGNDPLGKDLFKVRMQVSDKGKGQSGGARVIIQVKIIGRKVYVLSVYDKGDTETLTDQDLMKLLKKCGLD